MEKSKNKNIKSKKKENSITKNSSKKINNNTFDSSSLKIIVLLAALILVALPMYYYNGHKKEKTEKKYKHICLNRKIEENNIIYKSMLKECSTNEETSKSDEIISSIKFDDKYKSSEEYYIESAKDENYILKPSDIYKRLTKNTSIKISSKTGIEYKIDVKDQKVLITKLKDNSVNTLFDKDKIKYVILREHCCDKSYKLIFITIKDEVYVSDYNISSILDGNIKDVKFEKLSFKDIINVITKYSDANDEETETYAVDLNGTKYRID